MAGRLGDLQENVRKQERHAMFGRVAAGLVHDLSHPFKNIQNNCRLVVKMHDDPEYLELFKRTIEREFAQIKRVFEDLRNIARPMPMECFPLDLSKLAGDVAESMRANAATASSSGWNSRAPASTSGDMFALSRVTCNLVMNAIEATAPAGASPSARRRRPRCVFASRIRLRHPGRRIETMFEDFSDEAPGWVWARVTKRSWISRRDNSASGGGRGRSSWFRSADPPPATERGEGGWRDPATGRGPFRSCAGGRVLELLRDASLDDGLGRDLDGLAGRRVAAHARLALLDDELHHAGQHELARPLQLLLREHRQLVEELARRGALHFEAVREVREQF
jgi:hypothetical protein